VCSPRLLAVTAALALVIGLVMLALILLVAVLAPTIAARPGVDASSELFTPGGRVSIMELLKNNTVVLALYAIIVSVGVRRAHASVNRLPATVVAADPAYPADPGRKRERAHHALALLGLRARARRQTGAASTDGLVIGSALAATVTATLGHTWQFGQAIGSIGAGWHMAPTTIMRALVHGPVEMMALSLPLAALLIGLPRSRRAGSLRLLTASLLLALLLLGVAAIIEAHITPGLVQASWQSAS
jgi:hypothetical protein